jgi:type I restriction enzyme S subunit
MSETLPKGWIATELGQIVLHRKGKKPKSTIQTPKNGYVPYILIDEMEGKAIRAYTDDRTVPIAKEKDILIVWDGSIGKTATGLSGAIGSTIAALTPIVIPSNFLETFLKLSKPTIEQTSRGTGLQHINQTTFWPLSFPLPPLNEQKRIVAKLDKIMPRIDAVKERLIKVPAIIKRFRQSVLTAAVTGKLTEKWRVEHPDVESAEMLLERIKKERQERYKHECQTAQKNGMKKPKKPENINPLPIAQEDQELPISWISATFKDISSTEQYAMTSGPFGSALGTKDYQINGIPVIRGQNIQPAEFNSSNFVFISDKKANELKRSHTKLGDIVIVAVGAGVGNSAIVPNSINNAILSQNCNKFTVDKELVANRYILSALQISVIRTQMDESTTDTARQFLSLTNLKKMVYPIPPLEEQKEIVRQVDKLFALADRLESHYQKAKARVDKLSQSVLAKAFRGELVITEAELAEKEGRDFESAEKLLERILEEKAKLVGSRQRTVRGVRLARGSKGKQKEPRGKKK